MKNTRGFKQLSAVLACSSISLVMVGCGSSNDNSAAVPAPTNIGPVAKTYYDGSGDGLLGGFGLSGLQTPPASFYTDPNNPAKTELRSQAISANYRALVDSSDAGGFGRLYGPMDNTVYPGHEYLAFVGEGINRSTVMVQIPDNFNPNKACIVAAPSSGSRGVYGAIGTSGAWAVEHGCAAAYTDANKGTGAVDLTQGIGYGLQLNPITIAGAQEELSFQVPTQEALAKPSAEYGGVTPPSAAELADYVANNPHRYAYKHAHSQKNIEKDWGKETLEAIRFAFAQLNEQYPDAKLNSDNTLVIAASVSNGGGASLRAAEQDAHGLIDAVVVGEPNINPQQAPEPFSIAMGNRTPVSEHSKAAYEYFALAELYAPCAALAPDNTGALFALTSIAPQRCDALVSAGMIPASSDYATLGSYAKDALNSAGFLPESDKLLVGYAGINLFQSLLATYGPAYTRSSVVDNLCNISMSAVDGVTPTANTSVATLAATSNGIPRTANIFLIKNDSPDGPQLQIATRSTNGLFDYNFEGAQCWYDLYSNSDNPLHGRLMQGIDEVRGTGDLRGLPTIIVHGRADALIPVNHSSRPYYALNHQVEGDKSQLRYYEVTNSQHLDVLIQLYATAGMNYVPIDYYFKQAMDLMWSHLTTGAELPHSQVVAAAAPNGSLAQTDLPSIGDASAQPITYAGGVLTVPE